MTKHAPRTKCSRGHELTDDNVKIRNKGNGKIYKECKLCGTLTKRQQRANAKMENHKTRTGTTSKIIRSGVFGKDCMTLAEYKMYRG